MAVVAPLMDGFQIIRNTSGERKNYVPLLLECRAYEKYYKFTIMIKYVIKLIVAILLFAFCIYVEDYVQRGMGMFVGMAITCVGLLIGDSTDWREKLRDYLGLVGCALCFFFFIGIAMEIHIKETPDGIVVRSPFYTHVLERGNRMETKQLKSSYTQYYSKYEVKNDTFYFLYYADSCSIYNKYGKVLTIPDSFTIGQKDYGYGKLHYVVVNGKAYDMRGTEIAYGYKPYVADITPDYTSSPLN